jgi:subtilase family serine protease
MAYAVVASAALAAGTIGMSPTADAAARGHQLPGSVPYWAKASHDVGHSNTRTPVDFRVYLNSRGGDAAAKYALAVSTPGNKAYGHFLTPQQYNARYAPSASSVTAVKDWLRSQGFKVGVVPSNRRYVEAIGTVGQAARAFHTSFANYKVQGKTLRSNTSALVVPSSLTAVAGVVGLDESMALVHTDKTVQPPAGFRNAQPCSSYWGEKTVKNTDTPDGTQLPQDSKYQAFAPCGYAGAQLQGAYGMAGAIKSGNDGSGVTVAIIDAYGSATMLADANEYSGRHGLPTLNGLYSEHVAPGTKIRGDNSHQSPSGWAGEEALDVEAVHTMAPGAKILYVGSPNNYQDMDAAMNWIVSRKAADIVTNSYGWSTEALPPGYIKPFTDILIQANAEGISEFFSSGDNGDETGGSGDASQATPDWTAVSPWVTAVGGTSMGIAQDNSRIFELGWETDKYGLAKNADGTPTWVRLFYQYGSGGGTSRQFAQPDYQAGVVPDGIATANGQRSAPMRAVPDVAALGDPTTGMLVGQTQTWPKGDYSDTSDGSYVDPTCTGGACYGEYRIGGTSLSSPLYAGMFALAVQRAGHDFGLANPTLYALGTSSHGTSANNDITKAQRDAYPGAVRVDFVNSVNGTGGYLYSVRTFDSDESLTIHVRDGYDDVTGLGSPNGEKWLSALGGTWPGNAG